MSGELLVSQQFLRETAIAVQARHRDVRFAVGKKRSSGTREIVRPDDALAALLKKLNEFLRARLAPAHDAAHGFVRRRSTITNASVHLAQPAVLRVDLRDFFPSISASLVQESLVAAGFVGEATEIGCRLTTVEGALPIGFCTSPILSNAVFSATDVALSAWAASVQLNYTRYVDDLTFSGEVSQHALKQVTGILSAHNWVVNPAKSRLMKAGGKQYVTGLSVSDPQMPRIPRKLKKQLRFKLHVIQRYGYEAYMERFQGEALGDTPRRLIGMARHVAGVEPAFGGQLLRRLNLELPDYWADERDDEYWENWLADYD